MKKRNKPLSILMVWIMLLSTVPMTGFTAATDTGPPSCEHIHVEACYTAPDGHVCSEEAGCTPVYPETPDEQEPEAATPSNAEMDEEVFEAVTEQPEDTAAGPVSWECGVLTLVCEHKDCVTGEPCLTSETPDAPLGDTQEMQNENAVKADVATTSILADEGYSFATDTGELTLLTNAGTTAWRSNAGIAKTAVTSLVFDPAVTQIGKDAFWLCSGLTDTLDIPSNITSIGSSAFNLCSGLTGTLTVPATVRQIGTGAFAGCGFTTVDWETDAGIPSLCFDSCTSLSDLTFRAAVAPAVGTDAFKRVASTGTLTYPAGATGYNATNFPDLSGWTFMEDGSPIHVPVENITGIPATVDVGNLELDKYVEHINGSKNNYYSSKIWTLTPGNATNQKVSWAVTDAGSTEAAVTYSMEVTYAYIDGVLTQIVNTVTTLSITSDGTLVLKATVTDGTAPGDDYTQDFTITAGAPADPNDTNGDGYHDGDVAVINAMIANNGLTWRADDPASWPTSPIWGTLHERVEWNGASPKRITSLDIFGSNLTGTLNVSGLTALTILNCQGNKLTGLEVSGCSSLKEIKCIDNDLTGTLDVSGLTALERLWCDNNDLTAINVSSCTALKRLICSYNNLTTLDVSNLTTLQELRCFNNGLTALNVSGCTGMTSLSCSDNALASLNVSGLTALTNLNCYNNDLTELNVSGLTALKVLSCYGNSLTTLHMSGCTEMGQLWCYDNALTALDVSGLTKLFRLHCYNNDMSSSEGSSVTGIEDVTAFTGWSSDGNFRYLPQNIPVTGITGVPATATAGTPLALVGTVNPANATNKIIVWSVKSAGTTGATISGDTLNTTGTGTVTITATIENGMAAGTPYTQDFQISVSTGGGTEPHTHTYGTNWKYNDTHHWHECTAGDGARADEAVHIPGDWIVDQPATSNQDGRKHKECTNCRHVMETGTIPATGGGGNGNGGGHSYGNNDKPAQPIVTATKPNMPVVASQSLDVKHSEQAITVTITEAMAKALIENAQAEAQRLDKAKDGIAIQFHVTSNGSPQALTLNMESGAVKRLMEAGVNFFAVNTPVVDVSFNKKAIAQLSAQTSGTVTFTAKPAALSGEAKTLIGKRPAFDMTISYKKNDTIAYVTDLKDGTATIGIPYKPTGKEKNGSIQAVYINSAGKPVFLPHSSLIDNKLFFGAKHFSVYAVGYVSSAPAFTDIANHWAKDDIEFVAARGLLSGTGNNQFGPDTGVTRGMFVTALYRLAGSPQAAGESSDFTDVPADAYYTNAVKWAAQKGIVSGTTATTFAPDQVVARQEMAVIMANYAKALDYTTPKTREAVTFADSASIASWAKDSVKAMQRAGIMNGKDGNRFDPKGTATRAEAAAVLHRYVELVIDPATAQGWDQNDSGVWMYYENGKPVTGEKTIGGATYHFDAKGLLPPTCSSVLRRHQISGTWNNQFSSDEPLTRAMLQRFILSR